MHKRIMGLLMSLIMCSAGISPVHAAISCKPQLDSYEVKNSVDMEVNRIEIGESVNLSIDIKDSLVMTNEISSADDIDVISIDGSFGSTEEDSVVINSSGNNPLEYTINFKNAVYSGTGAGIGFKIKYKSLNLVSDRIFVEISQCSENSGSDNFSSDINSDEQPYIEISRSDIPTPIKPNEEFTVILNIKNRGNAELKRPYITLSMPDSILSLEGMGNLSLPNIKAGGSTNMTLKLKAANYIASASEQIDISLSYSYDTYSGTVTGSTGDRIFIPMTATERTAAPLVQITRDTLPSPIKPDSEFVLPITIKNIGDTDISSPILSVTLPEGLMLMEDNSDISLPNLSPEQEIKQNIRLKTQKNISSPSLAVSTSLKFNYMSANENTRGTEEASLTIPTVVNDDEAEPLIYIHAENPQKTFTSGESFSSKVEISNLSNTPIKAAIISFDASEGIILTGSSVSQNIGELKGGETKEITVSGKIAESISSSVQNVTGEFKYKYEAENKQQQGSESVKISLSTQASSSKGSTPNIIISSYNYGGVPIANGESFILDTVFKNTSKTSAVENIVMTVETGEGVSIRQASNTYYYERLAAEGTHGESIEMQVLPTAETGSVELNISFKYEYVENGERTSVTSEQKIAVPVYKPDKLEVNLDPLAPAQTGIEQNIVLNYVNKGKGDLSNVKAEIIGDVNALTPVQNLGNFEPGKSGSIYFVVVPDVPGELEFTIKLSYEDANMEQKVMEFPCVMNVEEYVPDDTMYDEPVEEETSSHKGLIIGGIAVAAAAAVLIIFFIRRKRKKKSANTVSVNWEEENEDT